MMQLTVIYEDGSDGWIVAWLEEIPGVMTQGRTMDEARTNLQDALTQTLLARHELAEREMAGHTNMRREVFQLAA
jgi:predicted RNase H-like HicB family nuclease